MTLLGETGVLAVPQLLINCEQQRKHRFRGENTSNSETEFAHRQIVRRTGAGELLIPNDGKEKRLFVDGGSAQIENGTYPSFLGNRK